MKVKGTGKSVSANGKGEFYLEKVEEGAELVISFIGYVSREVGASKEMGNVVLELSDSKLDEVQVIAYGTTTQRLRVGNVSSIYAADIAKQPVTNPLFALQGQIPGISISQTGGMPGALPRIDIRGQNSLNNFGTLFPNPLYIVDGVPIDPETKGGRLV
ncbi:TonB-dependent receptor plug domain-containing protein [Pedobacter steynii]